MTMNTYEVTDESAPAFKHRNRPYSTVQDWIAAGAELGEVEVRHFMQLIDDDEMRRAHESGLCVLCNETITVAERKQWEEIEMQHFDVKWDPTIRL